MRNRSQKTAETLLLEPTQNKEKRLPQARQTFAQRKTWKPASHQAKVKKKVFGTRMRKSRTPAGFVPKPCETAKQTFAQRKTWKPASHQTKPMKNALGTRMRKSRTPASFVPKPWLNCSRKNPETSLLEPTKNKEIVPKPFETAAGKMPKRCFWNLLKTEKKRCLKQGKPLRNVRLERPQATRPNSRKRCLERACEKAEP